MNGDTSCAANTSNQMKTSRSCGRESSLESRLNFSVGSFLINELHVSMKFKTHVRSYLIAAAAEITRGK